MPRLEAEIKQLKTIERPRIIKAIAEARAHGDLSENAEYHAAKEQQGMNEAPRRRHGGQAVARRCHRRSKLSGDTVKFGAIVQIVDEDTEEELKYQIVGDFEADVKGGKIAINSPIARALIGKRKGDVGRGFDSARSQILRDPGSQIRLTAGAAASDQSPLTKAGFFAQSRVGLDRDQFN